MKKIFYFMVALATFTTTAQVGIGVPTENINASAQLEVASTTKGFLPPRMTSAERNAISNPAAGLLLWCTNCGTFGELQVYNGTTWTNMLGGLPSVAIGDTFQGGIVAYILQAGDPGYDPIVQHGLIVATENLGPKLLVPNLMQTSEDFGTGRANTLAIIAANPDFDGAAQLVATYTAGGYTDWYLPSLNEGRKYVANSNLFPATYAITSSVGMSCDWLCQMGTNIPRQTAAIITTELGAGVYQNLDQPWDVVPIRSF